jgi:hypothetical protein
MSYALTITHETINEDYIEFQYEPDDKDLNRALAEVIAEAWFSESCKDKKLEEIIIKGLEELIENEEEVKKSMFNSFGVKDRLKEIFYDEAIEAYFD